MLIDATTSLPSGARLRVRLPHGSDRPGLTALLARLGLAADPLVVARALHFDPRRRTVAVATAWLGGKELLVAWGAIDRRAREPETLLADDLLAPGCGAVLDAALCEQARRRDAA